MGAALRKLNSRRGASIVLALVFFLICAVIGSIVLFTAYSNAGRLSHIEDEQQAYLTVSSASRLARGELDGRWYQVIEKTIDGAEQPSVITPAEGIFAAQINAWAEYIFEGGSFAPSGSSAAFTISSQELDEVSASFSMDANYKITAVLSLAGGRHAMTLSVPASVDVQSVTTTREFEEDAGTDDEGNPVTAIRVEVTVTTTTTITWSGAAIAKGGT